MAIIFSLLCLMPFVVLLGVCLLGCLVIILRLSMLLLKGFSSLLDNLCDTLTPKR